MWTQVEQFAVLHISMIRFHYQDERENLKCAFEICTQSLKRDSFVSVQFWKKTKTSSYHRKQRKKKFSPNCFRQIVEIPESNLREGWKNFINNYIALG